MAALRVLLLDHNRLKTLPDSLAACPSLVRLDVSNNGLDCLPENMGLLRQLKRLDCANNSLKAVPHSMGTLTLKEFDLRQASSNWYLSPILIGQGLCKISHQLYPEDASADANSEQCKQSQ